MQNSRIFWLVWFIWLLWIFWFIRLFRFVWLFWISFICAVRSVIGWTATWTSSTRRASRAPCGCGSRITVINYNCASIWITPGTIRIYCIAIRCLPIGNHISWWIEIIIALSDEKPPCCHRTILLQVVPFSILIIKPSGLHNTILIHMIPFSIRCLHPDIFRTRAIWHYITPRRLPCPPPSYGFRSHCGPCRRRRYERSASSRRQYINYFHIRTPFPSVLVSLS